MSELDERKIKLVELRLQGKNKTAISREIGISRPTVYEWLHDPEVVKQIKEGQQDLIQAGKNRLTNKLDDYLDILDDLAHTSNDKRTQASCTMYLTDRILGKVGAIDAPDDQNKDSITDDDILAAIETVGNEEKLKVIK